MGGGS
jgi:hypothetical protein